MANTGPGIQTSTGPSATRTDQLPDLRNTTIAFADKSNSDLWRAQWLFRIIGNAKLSAIGQYVTRFTLWLRLPIKPVIKATIFRQFCGGETIEASVGTAEKLAKSGIGTILDLSVEGQDEEAALEATFEELLRTITMAKERGDIPFCVFKPSGISRTRLLEMKSSGASLSPKEVVEWHRVRQRMDRLSHAAHNAGVPLLVDAEESWIQLAIDDLVDEMMALYNKEKIIIYNTIQLYRHDRLAFLKDSLKKADAMGYRIGMKLVRGAYMEKERIRAAEMGYPSPIHVDKVSVDRDYDLAMVFCLDHLDRMAFMAGTHNEESAMLLAREMQARCIPHNDPRIWFAQLLGMSDNISYNLAAARYRVAKYVPYGPVRKVLPYLIRRATENTSVKGQTGRELGFIMAERQRRRDKLNSRP